MSNEQEQFEKDLVQAARNSILKLFSGDSSLVMPDYANRIKLPAGLVQKIYDLIDYGEVMTLLRPKINELVADRIAAALSQELTNDVKRILSHEPTRLRLRLAVMQALETK